MRCQEARVLISARLDGELSQQEERELDAHLAGCPACRELAEDLSALRLSLEALEDEPAPAGLASRVMEQIRASETEKKAVPLFRRPQIRALACLAACAALCIGLYAASQARKSAELSAGFQADARALPEAAPAEGIMAASIEPEAETGEAPADLDAGEFIREAAMDAASTPGGSGAPQYKAEAAPRQTGGLAVAGEAETGAVLILSALPEGGEELLPPETAVSFSLVDRVERYDVTQEQFEALAALAQEQGLVIERDGGDGGPWTVVVSPLSS